MSTYLIQASAKWIKWAEQPYGKQSDLTSQETRTLDRMFNAQDITKARKQARTIYNKFCAGLPKENTSGLSGTCGLKVSKPIFGKVYPL